MSVPTIQNSFSAGEVSPSLYGRTDLARYHIGASTVRNCFVSYRGGAYSRAGTMFVGFSKQTGRLYPPRLIPFQFSINQGLALEFGNLYMRVISDGAYVVEPALSITGITQANPGVVTVATFSVATATPNNGSVTVSYAPGDTVTLTGGTFVTSGVLLVTNTTLLSLALNSAGTNSPGLGYAPGDIIALAGGSFSSQASLTVTHTQVIAAGVRHGGSGGTPGTQTVTGTTGTGTKFQASVTVSGGGSITAVLSITVAGNYTVNPHVGALNFSDNVTGASLSGAELDVAIGVLSFNITTPGVYTTNPASAAFTQASTTGEGIGATFKTAVMGPNALTVSNGGTYSVFPTNPVSQGSSSGSGAGATFNLTSIAGGALNTGDWVFISGVGGMTNVNGGTFVVTALSATTFSLQDVYGNNINTTGFPAYTSGGLSARIFTLTTPYNEQDLAYLKFTQSADVMSLCCVNQQTDVEYQPQDLSRITDTNWVFSPVVAVPSVTPPTSVTVANTGGSGTHTDYQYEVTSVSPTDGSESIASPIGDAPGSGDIAISTGINVVTWPVVTGVNEYNIYKVSSDGAGTTVPVPAGALFGYVGSAFGTQFNDNNIVPDLAQTPPTHQDPFSRGQIIGAVVTGTTGTVTSATFTITTATGSGAVLLAVIVSSALVAIIVEDPGKNYLPTDTVTVVVVGGGSATATLTVGPQTGTYPSVPSYFQQRRVYASSLNNPDTYWMSQPGSFTNFDTRSPTIASDAITGSPWSIQVNGIQFMVQGIGGLVVFTGLQAWQVGGAGTSALNPQPITPSTQQAQPQAFNGCSQTIPPIRIENEILYVQAKGSIVRDLSYQFYVNIYTGTDITLTSSQLFTGYTIREWAYSEEPYKIIWAVRNDGVLLSLTFLKSEQVNGWARHDTNGIFQSVCSVTEPPVDAAYLAVQRFPTPAITAGVNAYMVERMDDRIWLNVEDTWCVDCGLSLPQPTPNATLTANTATGLGACSAVTNLIGGIGYSSGTTAIVVDEDGQGPGSGAVPVLTIVNGVIINITFSTQGTAYISPALVISDPSGSGSGASATITLDNSATFTASASVFVIGNVGSVIRMGGGIAVITARTSGTQVTANILSPIVSTVPNGGSVRPQIAGSWTMTAPVTTLSGLDYLDGMTVTGLADGNVIPPTVVVNGSITLATAASAVTVGLGFQAQLQSLYLDAGEPTVQGQRKKVSAVTARIEASRGLKIGTSQVDGSTQSPVQVSPQWFIGQGGLTTVPDVGPNFPAKPYNALAIPLQTGDIRVPVSGGYNTRAQIAIQQDNPLPMQILAFVNEVFAGDTPQTQAPKREQRAGR